MWKAHIIPIYLLLSPHRDNLPHAFMNTHEHVQHTQTCTHTQTHIHMHTHTLLSTHTHMHPCSHIHTFAHTATHTPLGGWLLPLVQRSCLTTFSNVAPLPFLHLCTLFMDFTLHDGCSHALSGGVHQHRPSFCSRVTVDYCCSLSAPQAPVMG